MIKEWFKKNRDWLITLGVFGILGLMGLIWSVFFRDQQLDKAAHIIEDRAVFTLPADRQNSDKQSDTTEKSFNSSTFYLQPGPEEILSKLENLSYQEFSKETKELPGLKVMWPAYFFSINKVENNMAEVVFDANKDGFGALIQTRIDTSQYPEIRNLARGTKIWLAGEISGVDPTGTGQFELSTEHVHFDDYRPPTSPNKEK
ncbi:MAG: hypothetical protein QNJ17_04190 [Desulfocapsaceae bacterium]|nr:hypothetical protein [Desulfocapsaceae bacterium]